MHRFVCMLVLAACADAAAQDNPTDAFPLRAHNPFLQVYGMPAFQTQSMVAPGGFDISLGYDVANDADDAELDREVLVIDAETTVVNLSLRRRIGERFEVGLDIPWVRHSGGYLDRVIFDFHDLVGLSNSAREGPDDRLQLYFERDGVTSLDISSPVSGIGDIQLSAATAIGRATLRAGIKAPTGSADKLTGSGAVDLSLGVYGGGTRTLFGRELDYSVFAGVLKLGNGDVLPDLQRSVIPYGGGILRWHATSRLSLATQLYIQGPYFEADLDELGGTTFQLAFGGDYRLPQPAWLFRFAIAEDIAAGAAPDFALHLSVRRFTR
jgi:hypothetical protein